MKNDHFSIYLANILFCQIKIRVYPISRRSKVVKFPIFWIGFYPSSDKNVKKHKNHHHRVVFEQKCYFSQIFMFFDNLKICENTIFYPIFTFFRWLRRGGQIFFQKKHPFLAFLTQKWMFWSHFVIRNFLFKYFNKKNVIFFNI